MVSELQGVNSGSNSLELATSIDAVADRAKRPFPRNDTGFDISELSELPEDVVDEVLDENAAPSRSPVMKRKERVQLFALFFAIFLAGWDGGMYGPLIPRFQAYYHVNYAVVSLIFIANCVGFLSGAASNVYLTDKLGFGKVLVIGSVMQVLAYTLMAPPLPFPVFCIAFFINGWGISLQDAQCNGYVAGLSENSSEKMGLMHAIYGLGAMIAPFSATQFAQMPRRWSFHFVVSVGLAAINMIILLVVFKGKDQDECYNKIGEPARKRGTSQHSKYRQILTNKVTHLMAFFSLVYVGVEITLGGWTVSYLQEHRGGGPSTGYVSTGFFGGLTLGRVALLWLNAKVGEHRVMYIYMLLSIGLELVVWLVPNMIVAAVAVSFVGFFLGPMYPILMNEAGRLIPQWLLTGSIGWIASFGFSGSAIFPFATGALAERFGIVSLQPVIVVLMAVMIGLFLIVPDGTRQKLT